jgi:hypothetical protein
MVQRPDGGLVLALATKFAAFTSAASNAGRWTDPTWPCSRRTGASLDAGIGQTTRVCRNCRGGLSSLGKSHYLPATPDPISDEVAPAVAVQLEHSEPRRPPVVPHSGKST